MGPYVTSQLRGLGEGLGADRAAVELLSEVMVGSRVGLGQMC